MKSVVNLIFLMVSYDFFKEHYGEDFNIIISFIVLWIALFVDGFMQKFIDDVFKK